MKVLRAHNYDELERIRRGLELLPEAWREVVRNVPWIVLPRDLSPLWVGLIREDTPTHAGFTYNEAGGWYAHDWGWQYNRSTDWVTQRPHIFLREGVAGRDAEDGAVHEAAHALAALWKIDVAKLFRPDRALHEYMASSAHEYFACAATAFTITDDHPHRYNRNDLGKRDPEMLRYLTALSTGRIDA